MLKIVSILLLLSISSYTMADWANVGIATNCDTNSSQFNVASIMETSDTRYDIKPLMGFEKVIPGKNNAIACKINGIDVNMKVSVYGPQARGMGQGGGVILIESLSIGGDLVIDKSTNFNWQVIRERVLTSISVTSLQSKVNVEMCFSNGWSWDSAYENVSCEERQLTKGSR